MLKIKLQLHFLEKFNKIQSLCSLTTSFLINQLKKVEGKLQHFLFTLFRYKKGNPNTYILIIDKLLISAGIEFFLLFIFHSS